MVTLPFNHIQGKNGSHWNRLTRKEKAKEYCIVAIYAANLPIKVFLITLKNLILNLHFLQNDLGSFL